MQSRENSPPNKRVRKEDLKPSKVLFISKVQNPNTCAADFHDALGGFGFISHVMCMDPEKQIALVEFEDLASAEKCMAFVERNGKTIEVAGSLVQIHYSNFQNIKRSRVESESPTKILTVSISNVRYPVNAEIIKKICDPHGEVIRIAVIRQAQLRALVELSSVDEAIKTKRALNGADIYAGCCTLKAEFSSIGQLEIKRSDEDHYQAGDVGYVRNVEKKDNVQEPFSSTCFGNSGVDTTGFSNRGSSHYPERRSNNRGRTDFGAHNSNGTRQSSLDNYTRQNNNAVPEGIGISGVSVNDGFGNSGFGSTGFQSLGFDNRGASEFADRGRGGGADYRYGPSRNDYSRQNDDGGGFGYERKTQDSFGNDGIGNSGFSSAGFEASSGFRGGRGSSQFNDRRGGRGNRGMSDPGSRGRGVFQPRFDKSGSEQRGRGFYRGGQH